ncbi:hypothetical protein ACFXO2_00200 [Streptomyces sp. NPDC059152]|uniref:hypothetical protein n=1 Tax=Streptomyces sp. NPDC059152 TaxID=3346742 RepID=UPI003678338D
MPSALGLLEAKESAGREAVERAREGAARVAALLDEAERPLERLVIAREAVVEVLAEPVARVAPRRRCRGGMRAKDLAAPLGLGGVVPAKIEGVRSRADAWPARSGSPGTIPGSSAS